MRVYLHVPFPEPRGEVDNMALWHARRSSCTVAVDDLLPAFLFLCSTTVKKPTCAAFSLDGAHAFVGDKFGDVAVGATASGASAPLLGHYCSTISSMAVSPDGVQTTAPSGHALQRQMCMLACARWLA